MSAMYSKDDIQAAVDQRKKELLMKTRIGRSIIRDEAIVCLVRSGYVYSEAARLFDLIDHGSIRHIAVQYGDNNAL